MLSFSRQISRVVRSCSARTQHHSFMRTSASTHLHQQVFNMSLFNKSSDEAKEEDIKKDTNEASNEEQKEEVPVFTQTQYDELQKKLAEEAKEWKDQLARTLAEKENFRMRMERQVEEAESFSIRKFAKDLVEVADVLQMAIENVKPEKLNQDTNPDLVELFEGLKATNDMLHKKFDRHHVKSMNPVQMKFDPDFHEAKFEVPHEHADGLEHGHVHSVAQLGYTIKGRVLRPAAVGVVKKPQ
eukprot:m.105505 g.105505  ORF g.105505 m.105505 type:complete len:242 (+) comp12656_c0_seq1:96-821(+)